MSKAYYILRAEFGTPLHTGTKEECEMVRAAMIAYGIPDRKLHLDEYDDHSVVTQCRSCGLTLYDDSAMCNECLHE